MRIELKFKKSSMPGLATRAYDPDEDDIRSILTDVCRMIEPRCNFIVSAFGQDRWPVDVGTDLPVFLEQLPDVLQAVNAGMATAIDFYEQGIERSILFSPIDRRYLASCTSGTAWQPDPSTEYIDREDLERMLLAAREEFMRAFAEAAPNLVAHPWMRHWLESRSAP